MDCRITSLLDEILRFEEMEKDNLKEKNLLLNEIEDVENKIEQLKSESVLEKVIAEVIDSFQKTSQILENQSNCLMTNTTFKDISQTREESRQLEGEEKRKLT